MSWLAFIPQILKYIRIGKTIFDQTEDTLEIVNDKSLNKKEKCIEILKTVPDNLLELGFTEKKKGD